MGRALRWVLLGLATAGSAAEGPDQALENEYRKYTFKRKTREGKLVKQAERCPHTPHPSRSVAVHPLAAGRHSVCRTECEGRASDELDVHDCITGCATQPPITQRADPRRQPQVHHRGGGGQRGLPHGGVRGRPGAPRSQRTRPRRLLTTALGAARVRGGGRAAQQLQGVRGTGHQRAPLVQGGRGCGETAAQGALRGPLRLVRLRSSRHRGERPA